MIGARDGHNDVGCSANVRYFLRIAADAGTSILSRCTPNVASPALDERPPIRRNEMHSRLSGLLGQRALAALLAITVTAACGPDQNALTAPRAAAAPSFDDGSPEETNPAAHALGGAITMAPNAHQRRSANDACPAATAVG